ncbi:LuxR C-terminal-related transcriptional regulator [uncultured Polaribacter sp.]|uniref:LuxR C-terminal-related transcriptional regulator n=1 Tax=uncultured Polaribacter sp. TaxID=174711 RepID=UPI00261BD7B8|nr:LuxR C-terminal-related transcriptional regulator [uncultured Polaribacter sp.]
MRFRILFFILFLVVSLTNAQSDIFFFKDVAGNLDFATVKQKSFKVLEKQILEEYSEAVYWFKVPPKNTDSVYVFKVLYERIQQAKVYKGKQQLRKLQNERYLTYQFSRDTTVYIKVNPKLHGYIPVSLETKEKSTLANNNALLLNGFYYGFAVLVIIYNLFYFFLFKDDAFLFYALFLTSMTFGLFTMDGMLNFYNIPENVNTILMTLNYSSLAYFSSKFAYSYMLLDRYYPKIKKLTNLIGGAIVLLTVLYFYYGNYYFLLYLNLLVFGIFLLFWFCAVLLFNKNIYIKILTIGYAIILFSAIDFYIFKFLGIPFGNINPINIKIGAFLEMIILSIAVLYRVKVIKEENEFMRSDIIQYSNELKTLKANNQQDNTKNGVLDLSLRELEVFNLIVIGKTNKEISNEINISINTVKFHLKNIYDKLNIKSRKEAKNLNKPLNKGF